MKKKPKKKSSKKIKGKTLRSLTPELVDETSSQKSLAYIDPVAKYLEEIKRYPLLSKEEEKKIAVQYYENRDPKSAEILVTSNLRFVVKVALEYAKFGARLIDLIQEGNVGLMHAVKEFNPYKDVRLITYAVWWIRGYIQDYLMRQYSMVRVGTTASQRKLFYQLEKKKEELERLGLEPTVKQISGRLGVSEKDVHTMERRLGHRDVSLDQPLSEDDHGTLVDLQTSDQDRSLEDELSLKQELGILEEKLAKLKPQLNDRELDILENRLLSDNPVTLQEIGDKYGVTREAVRQLEARIIEKLRNI